MSISSPPVATISDRRPVSRHRSPVARPWGPASGLAMVPAMALSIVLIAILSVLSACGPSEPVAEEEALVFPENREPPRNLVVLVVDTLRQDRLGAYGYERPTSPVLDRLAAEGVRADGLAPSSWTKPSTASLLSGLHPLRHQAFGRDDALPPGVRMLAQALEDEGFQSLGISANTWVTRAWGFDRGFDEFHSMKALGYGHLAHGGEVNEAVLPRLESLESPFFLYVHYIDPHMPYDPEIHWDGGAVPPRLAERAPMTFEGLAPLNFVERDPRDVQAASDLYDGEIRSVDRRIGELVERLDQLGKLEETLVVVTSDHGEEFEDHGRLSHGHTLYQEQTRVPLIFHHPGSIPAGGTLGRVPLMDVFPTVLEMLGAGNPSAEGVELDGESRAAEILDPRRAVDDEGPHLLHLDFDDGHSLGLIDGDEKILLSKFPYTKAVYDLEADPREQEPLFPGDADAAARLDGLGSELARQFNRLRRDAFERSTTTIDEELAESIRALGYVAFAGRGSQRMIPRRIQPPDLHPDGRLGWEDPTPEACIDVGPRRYQNQLLAGWHNNVKAEARWSRPEASLLLGRPEGAGPMRLEVAGLNHRGRGFDLEVSLLDLGTGDETVLFDDRLPAGDIRLDLPVPEEVGAGPFLVRLVSSPPFRPWTAGLPDRRTLGTYFESVCLKAGSG